jgi:hypothetical protein
LKKQWIYESQSEKTREGSKAKPLKINTINPLTKASRNFLHFCRNKASNILKTKESQKNKPKTKRRIERCPPEASARTATIAEQTIGGQGSAFGYRLPTAQINQGLWRPMPGKFQAIPECAFESAYSFIIRLSQIRRSELVAAIAIERGRSCAARLGAPSNRQPQSAIHVGDCRLPIEKGVTWTCEPC